MSEVLRAGDTLARLGGDEFVAVLADMPGAQACEALLQRLLDVACRPVRIDELELNVTASLGVTFFPQAEDVDADQLLRQADQAMYQAKLAGKNRFHLFDAASDRHLRGYIARVASLREALTMQQFVLHYQPKVNLKTRQLVGVEALLRWEHPQDGMLLPGRFLPQIEGHQLSLDIGSWVIRQALTQVATWRTLGHAIAVSVNVSPHQIRQADFVPWLEAELQARQLPPYCLELEILESSALHDLDQVAEFIRRCAAIQVGVALDDFGTGYSSLSHLKRFPTSTIKIDQTFVRDILHNADNKSILDGVLWIMRQLRRTVIAEGVETPAHGRALVDLGCELGQGYAIAWPMPAAELLDWLQVWSAVTPGPD